MSTPPDPRNGHRPIPPIHPDTIAFERILGELPMGGHISYEDLAAHVRRDPKAELGAIKSHIRSAERRLLNSRNMVFTWYHDEKTDERGRVRLDDRGITEKGQHQIGRLNRAAKRIERMVACADFDKLTDEQRHEAAATMVAARGAGRFSSSKGRAQVRRIVSSSNGRIPELEQAWKALTGS